MNKKHKLSIRKKVKRQISATSLEYYLNGDERYMKAYAYMLSVHTGVPFSIMLKYAYQYR